jgi:hypothetical protein
MELNALCRRGIEALDRALAGEVDPANDPLGLATRCTAGLRDELIARLRAGDAGAAPLLTQANSLLSELCAAEFPLAGFRRDRVAKAREAWQRLLEAAGQRP